MELTNEAIVRRTEALKDEILQTWKSLVNRDCGTANKAGVDACGAEVGDFLRQLGFDVRFHEFSDAGNLLVAEKGPADAPFVALVGHLDTVFADGASAERPFTVKDGIVTGPGVLDMKGGVTVLLFALKILAETGSLKRRVKVLLAGDEENGHKNSAAGEKLLDEVQGALFGLNFETSYEDNSVIVERKGVAQFRIDIDGIGAHVGNDPKGGRSAVTELAHKILDVNALTDYDEGSTLNVGVIGGGTVANACPEKAWAVVDLRYKTRKAYERVWSGVKALEEKHYLDGTATRVTALVKVEPMERLASSLELFERVNAIAVENGFPAMTAKAVGGGSDSAFLTAAGVPTVCALGVKGKYNHTVREYAVLDSVFERIRLAATLLRDL